MLVFLLESVLFILIGLQVPHVLDALDDRSAVELAGWAAAVSATVIAVRIAWVLAGPGLRDFALRERAVVAWSGMRGAIALAAALSLPVAVPQRDALLFVTLAVIGVTLILQGLTLPWLVRRLGVEADEDFDARQKALARFRTVEAALATIADLGLEADGAPPALVDRAREMYTERARQLIGDCRSGPLGEDGDPVAWNQLRRRLLQAEREALADLLDDGSVPLAVIREVERDLDLEEGTASCAPRWWRRRDAVA